MKMAGIVRGFDAMKDFMQKGMEYIKMKSGESLVIRIAVSKEDIMGVYEHFVKTEGQQQTVTCLGKGVCPLCKSGNQASFKAYLPVLINTVSGYEEKVKIFKASKEVTKLVMGLVEEYGDLRSRDYKITRNGDGLKTTYQFFPRDPSVVDLTKYEIPNIEEIIQPKPVEEVQAIVSGGITETTTATVATDPGEYPF
jgi:hypothetical protein